MIVYHECSVEHLFHYRCGQCKTWWTLRGKYVEAPTCPHCDTKAAAVKHPLPPTDEGEDLMA